MLEKQPEFTPEQEALMKQRDAVEKFAGVVSESTDRGDGIPEDSTMDVLHEDALADDDEQFGMLHTDRLPTLKEGEAMVEAQCSMCDWTSRRVFTVGDEERDIVRTDLEEAHDRDKNGLCAGELNFKETRSEDK